jgi:hypothetical protein
MSLSGFTTSGSSGIVDGQKSLVFAIGTDNTLLHKESRADGIID